MTIESLMIHVKHVSQRLASIINHNCFAFVINVGRLTGAAACPSLIQRPIEVSGERVSGVILQMMHDIDGCLQSNSKHTHDAHYKIILWLSVYAIVRYFDHIEH